MTINPVEKQIASLLLGLAVGDALGVPVEFTSREMIAQRPITGMTGYGTHNQPPGTFSDDSSLAFCLAESLIQWDMNVMDIAEKFIQWQDRGVLDCPRRRIRYRWSDWRCIEPDYTLVCIPSWQEGMVNIQMGMVL
jgi:ADP-ribosylglycohydrolase